MKQMTIIFNTPRADGSMGQVVYEKEVHDLVEASELIKRIEEDLESQRKDHGTWTQTINKVIIV